MNISLLIIGATVIYILDVFFLTWLSGRFVGIGSMTMKNVGILGLAIILVSWLFGSALIVSPLIIKPLILLIAAGVIIAIFVFILDTHKLKAAAAGLFFIVCQLLIIIVLFKELWTTEFFDIVKFMLFQSF